MRNLPWFIFPVTAFIFFSFQSHLSIATNSLSPGQSLSGKQTITSQNGNYVLGFFTPGKSLNYYIGIWQNKISKPVVVWVANRGTPLPNTSSELKISEDGNLVLLDRSKNPIWSTNFTSRISKTTVAVLLDTGNLVLRDELNSSLLFWQSFDHPTDTWLPGGKIGFNKITGEMQRLTSWTNSEDPAPGRYSHLTNGSNMFFLLWNGYQKYWNSGAWNGKFFSGIAESTALVSSHISNSINFSYVSNENENYFTYFVHDTSLLVRIQIDFSTGKLGVWAWMKTIQEWMLSWSAPTDQCDAYSLCGAFGSCSEKSMAFCTCLLGFEPRSLKDWNLGDRSGGCVRKTSLQCETDNSINSGKDGFLKIPNVRFPENSLSLTLGAEECESVCLNNCSCTAYAYGRSCLIWIGDLQNVQQLSDGESDEGNSGDLYLFLAASDLPKSKNNRPKIIGITIGAITGTLAVLGTAVLFIRRFKQKKLNGLKGLQGSLDPFSYNDLQNATKNFSERLGGGSFGSVFKGTLPNSTAIAVKQLEGLRQGEKEFRMEVNTLGIIQHVNLVHLHGFCSEGMKKLLVYDYMPNGSLDLHLFKKRSEILDWKTRYKIALGTARGLAYLHEKCRDCIIHCDIKPENILLDAEFCPKVADFGMAKLLGREFSKVLTTMRGTIGYLAPEWISGLPITPKADVYSYGMMLLEIISGSRNTDGSHNGIVVYFPVWAARKLNEGDILSIVDTRLEGEVDMEELSRACRAACWCIQDQEISRPTMGQVIQILEGVVEVNIPPVPTALQHLVENQGTMVFSESPSAKINIMEG